MNNKKLRLYTNEKPYTYRVSETAKNMEGKLKYKPKAKK